MEPYFLTNFYGLCFIIQFLQGYTVDNGVISFILSGSPVP